MPLQATSGAASYDAFGGGAAAVPNYIEEVFQTWLYTGNGSTQTITNGIDLSTKGGLFWMKNRGRADYHFLVDSARGLTKGLATNRTTAQETIAGGSLSFQTTGVGLSGDFYIGGASANESGQNYVGWTFRKQPKFFDIQTFTTTTEPSSPVTISHNLGSTPGFVFIKNMSLGNDWYVYHRSLGNNAYLTLNTTDASASLTDSWAVTSTTVTIKDNFLAASSTFVVYLCAHDAGGFGLTGTDNVISCGSYTGTGAAGNAITLGYEPQWLLVKSATYAGQEWGMFDSMRGLVTGSGGDAYLYANSSGAEGSGTYLAATATGFSCEDASARYNNSGDTYIYIAIRRGPMKVPTSGTSVFAPALGVSTTPNMVAGFPVDSFLGGDRDTPTSTNWKWWDRLRGNVASLLTTTTAAEDTSEYNYGQFQSMTGFISGNYDASDKIGWMFRRAPSFFDEVCWSGAGANLVINHNLQAVPELIINKYRNGTSYGWATTAAGLVNPNTNYVRLNTNGAEANSGSSPGFIYDRTSTTFTVSSDLAQSGFNWVSYLFATCPGVSKVGSYTGTATTKQIDCGFTGGARFVLIKRIDDVGDWYVWDSARGIVAGNDPYLLINSTAAEVTSTDYVDTYSAGFEITSTAPAAINASGGSFIFLAIS